MPIQNTSNDWIHGFKIYIVQYNSAFDNLHVSSLFIKSSDFTCSISGQKLSRAAYAKLYTAGFPQILDDRGEAPEVIDPADILNFLPAKEEADRLQANEIYFQFLAFAR